MIKLALEKQLTEEYFKNYSKLDWKKKYFPVKDNAQKLCNAVITIGTEKFSKEFMYLIEDYTNLEERNVVFKSDLALSLQRKTKLAENRVKVAVQGLNKETKQLMNILKDAFKEDTYIVGGFVRDAIAGYDSNDVDFCTSIPYNKLKEVFDIAGWDSKDTGKQFLVLNVTHPVSKENFEIAALRKDKDNEGAQVGTIDEDAQRRDFVNSCIYFSVKTEAVIDPSGKAILDCQSNTLRFMGKAKDRILEDPARVFRGYKMIGRGWEPEPKTLRAIRENFEFAVKNTSSTRVMNEIEKMAGL